MKLKDTFITHLAGDTQILLSTDERVFSGLVRSNRTAAFIVGQLQKDTTKEAILGAMKEKYHGDEKLMAEDIDLVIGTLARIGAIERE